jgi:hypothetical protein
LEQRGNQEGKETKFKKNNSIEDLVRNEENGWPVPDPNKTMSPVTLKKKCLKEEIMEEITEKLMEKLQYNQKVQDALKKFQDTTNKNLEKTQKQLNELRQEFDKTKLKQRRV